MPLFHKRHAVVAAAGTLALFAACKDSTSVPDLNNVSSATIAGGLNAATVQLLTSGLLNNNRQTFGFRFLVFAETMARDIYNLDPAENRFITEALGGAIDPGGFVGGSFANWNTIYQGIRTENTLIDNLSTAKDLTAAQQAGVRGIARTIKALDLYRIWELRGSNGLPVDVDRPLGADLAPILCGPNALAAISALLDSAATDLNAAGTSFAVSLPAGFSLKGTFNTPQGFLKFNRGLKGRVEVYRGLTANRAQSFTDAITAINASFIDTTATDLTGGVYYVYSTAPGETQRPVAVNTIHLNPAVGDSIQPGDLRKSKIVTVARVSRNGVATTYDSPLSNPADLTTPMAVLRNAELILLRAQAEIGLNQLDAATRDINVVRRKEGGLPNYPTFTSQTAAINALLYEKRYSLLLEGAQRLVDLRSYNRLNAQNFKQEIPSDVFNSQLPIPKTEVDLRGGSATCQ